MEINGIVCETCDAYWHYVCAELTQEEIDVKWKDEFYCKLHRNSMIEIRKPQLPVMSNTRNDMFEEEDQVKTERYGAVGGVEDGHTLKKNMYHLKKGN